MQNHRHDDVQIRNEECESIPHCTLRMQYGK
jgi:hypothetical protein